MLCVLYINPYTPKHELSLFLAFLFNIQTENEHKNVRLADVLIQIVQIWVSFTNLKLWVALVCP